ncbi:MAG: hypothetical protein V4733_04345 [Verrucomicrobiota bacterium]
MKTKLALFLSTTSLLHAGPPDVEPIPGQKPEPWIKPVIDIRARYEFGDVDELDPSHAFSIRERLGLKTMAWNGFSAFIEGEFSQAVIDDYNGSAGPGAEPFDPFNTPIADPETNELNQLYLQYEGFDTMVKLGRQRIIYDNAAFVGNVGWRQNEQTYDGISFANKSIDGLTLNYSYVTQVNRIFGSDADLPISAGPPPFTNVQDLNAEVHLFNASYAGIPGVTLGGYAYIMNFEDLGTWDNNTFGMSAKGTVGGITLYGEAAWQDKADVMGEEDALYAHATATKTFGTQSVTLGVEHLDAGFKTPLATVHLFNGFADATDGGRIAGAHNGLTDVYVSHTIPLFCGIKWTNALHGFGDNEISTGYGWEFDSVLSKKFDDNFTVIAKFAHLESEGDVYIDNPLALGLPTTTRVSVELNYTF